MSPSPMDSGAGDLAGQVCTTHAIEFVPLHELRQADAHPVLGRALRVVIGVPLRAGCDVLGDVAVDVMIGNATDFARVSARVWRGSGGCGAVEVQHRVVIIDGPLSNLNLQVHDGAPNGTLQIFVTPAMPGPKTCAPLGLAAACQFDCEYDAGFGGARCIDTGAGPLCALSCSRDSDCGLVLPHCELATFTCKSDPTLCCAGGCPFAQSCQFCVCHPDPGAASGACVCDADCGAERLCADGRCIAPCTNVSDCPAGQNICGGGQCSSTT